MILMWMLEGKRIEAEDLPGDPLSSDKGGGGKAGYYESSRDWMGINDKLFPMPPSSIPMLAKTLAHEATHVQQHKEMKMNQPGLNIEDQAWIVADIVHYELTGDPAKCLLRSRFEIERIVEDKYEGVRGEYKYLEGFDEVRSLAQALFSADPMVRMRYEAEKRHWATRKAFENRGMRPTPEPDLNAI